MPSDHPKVDKALVTLWLNHVIGPEWYWALDALFLDASPTKTALRIARTCRD